MEEENKIRFNICKIDPKTRQVLKIYQYASEIKKDGFWTKGGSFYNRIDKEILHNGFFFKYEKIINIEGEIWKSIEEDRTGKDKDKKYLLYISNMGRVKDIEREVRLNISEGKKRITIKGKNYMLNELVIKYFSPDYDKYIKDKKKYLIYNLNENMLDSRLENLKVMTCSEYIKYMNELSIKKSSNKIILQISNYDNKVIKEYDNIELASIDLGLKEFRIFKMITNKIPNDYYKLEFTTKEEKELKIIQENKKNIQINEEKVIQENIKRLKTERRIEKSNKTIEERKCIDTTGKIYKYNIVEKKLTIYENLDDAVIKEKIKRKTLLEKIYNKTISTVRNLKWCLFSFTDPTELYSQQIENNEETIKFLREETEKENKEKTDKHHIKNNKYYNKEDYESDKDLYSLENGKEIWKICSILPKYEISSYGRVKNIKSKNIYGISQDVHGYIHLNLRNDNGYKSVFAHNLVMLTFIGECPEGMSTDHINKIRSDNRLCNLRYISRTEQNYNQDKTEKKLRFYIHKIDPHTKKIVKIYKYKSELIKDNHKYKNIAETYINSGNIYDGFLFETEKIVDMEGEIWKRIKESKDKGYYLYISNMGRIKDRERLVRINRLDNDYQRIVIKGVFFRVHVLVAQYFLIDYYLYIFNIELVLNHKDGNKINNRADNLEIITKSENTQHAHDIGLIQSVKILKIKFSTGELIKKYQSISSAARNNNLKETNIKTLINKKKVTNDILFKCENKDDEENIKNQVENAKKTRKKYLDKKKSKEEQIEEQQQELQEEPYTGGEEEKTQE